MTIKGLKYCPKTTLLPGIYPEQLREVTKELFAVLNWESIILFYFSYHFCTVLNDAAV